MRRTAVVRCRGVSAARALPRVLQSASFTAIAFWSLSRRHHRHCSIALHQHNRLALQKPGCSSRCRTQPLCSRHSHIAALHRATTRTHCTTSRATRCTCSAQASHHTCTARIVSKDGGTRRRRRPLPTQTARSRKPKIDLCRLRRGQNKMHLPGRPPRPQGHETKDKTLTYERRDAGRLRALDAAQGPALRLPAAAGPEMVSGARPRAFW